MNEGEKHDFFTHKESLIDVIESLFTPKGFGLGAVLKVVVGIMSIGWLADSILPIIHSWALDYFNSPNANSINKADVSYQLFFATIWFLAYISILFVLRRRKMIVGKYKAQESSPHRGLIVSLSNYVDFTKDKALSLKDLERLLDSNTLNIENFYNSSNWGQLAFSIAHHSDLLQKCWLCTTSKSSIEFSVAEKLINYVSHQMEGRQIICENIELENEYDISEMARKVSRIYKKLEGIESVLNPSDVISNFTGGTAAMSGGMIMATLNKNRKIEYINQRYLRNLSNKLLKDNYRTMAIVSSETNVEIIEGLN